MQKFAVAAQPNHPFVGRRNQYQSQDGDALRLGVKACNRVWVAAIVIPLLSERFRDKGLMF